MITFITGVPGSGKTLHALSCLITDAEFKDRHVYTYNIELLPEAENYFSHSRFETINEVRDAMLDLKNPIYNKAIFLIDEAQDVYPQRTRGEPPDYVKAFEKHRHHGVDFILITQRPNAIDIHCRELVSHHKHVARLFSAAACTVYHAQGFVMTDRTERSKAAKKTVRYNKNLFKIYNSARMHTGRQRIPLRVWFFFLLVPSLPLAVWWAFSSVASVGENAREYIETAPPPPIAAEVVEPTTPMVTISDEPKATKQFRHIGFLNGFPVVYDRLREKREGEITNMVWLGDTSLGLFWSGGCPSYLIMSRFSGEQFVVNCYDR